MVNTVAAQPAAARRDKSFYAPELDCLRFVAFLGVFVFHTLHNPQYRGLPAAVNAVIYAVSGTGQFGVDLFFVLSAYLITELLLREKELQGKVMVRDFYLRRILRIWPLYFFFLGIATLLPRIDPSESFGAKYLIGYSLLAGNWMIVHFGWPNSVANPLWSVSIEEQFYLCWAPVVKRLSVRGITNAVIFLLLTSNLTRLFMYSVLHSENRHVLYNSLARLDPIALGIALTLLARAGKIHLTRAGRLGLVGVSFLALIFVARFSELNAIDQPMSALGLLSFPLIALGCFGMVTATLGLDINLMRNAMLTYLGRISYGLYVYHLFGLWIAKRAFGPPLGMVHFSIYVVAGFFSTVLLAAASYHLLEAPFLRLKKRFTYVQSRPV